MRPSAPLAAQLLFLLLALGRLTASAGNSLTLASDRDTLILGEPLYLHIESPSVRPPSLEEGRFLLAIQSPGEAEWIYRPPLRYRTRPDTASDIAGDSNGGRRDPRVRAVPKVRAALKVRFARLIAADGGLLFRKPGRYRLRLVATGGAGEGFAAVSDTLFAEIREPAAARDRRAFGLIARNPGEYALAVYLEGGDQLREGMAIIRELAAFESAYARTASFVLSSDWAQDFTDYSRHGGPASRPMDLQKALAWSQWDLDRGLYIPLRTAFRLGNAADLLSARDPGAPGLAEVRGRLAAFLSGLTPVQAGAFHSFR